MSQKKLEIFFTSSSQNKRKLNEHEGKLPSDRDKKYDREKRVRKFQDSWHEKWPWVEFDDARDVMTCKYCTRYPSILILSFKHFIS